MKIPTSKRARRVGVELQKIVSEYIRREAGNLFPGVVVSVPEVRVSDDLGVAALYTSILPEEERERVQLALKKALPRLRREAAASLRIRKLPEFRFVWDDTMERADRIEQLLNEIHNSSSPPEEDDGGDS